MLSVDDIKHRAVLMGICTGQMPDVEFIWSVQRIGGSRPCFGRGRGCCSRECVWRRKCLLLSYFAEVVALPAWEGVRERRREGMGEQRKQEVLRRSRKGGKREMVFS